MEAGIVDLRYRMKAVLAAIERGETVTILYRGKPKARLSPVRPAARASGGAGPKVEDLPLFGLWKDRQDMADPGSYLRKLREPRQLVAARGRAGRRRSGKPE